MWEHLHATVGMPHSLLGAIQGLVKGDSCVVRDGDNTSAMIYPEHGVRQGCPLGPVLCSLYIIRRLKIYCTIPQRWLQCWCSNYTRRKCKHASGKRILSVVNIMEQTGNDHAQAQASWFVRTTYRISAPSAAASL
jgi:hypothetical protein